MPLTWCLSVYRPSSYLTLPQHSTTLPHTDDRYTNPDGPITGLAFSPISNLLAFTAYNGSFSRWTDPIPKTHPSPTVSDAIQAKTLDKLLDDEFGDEDGLDIEERGEDIDDWIVDDDGYAEEEGKGRREVVSSTKAQPAFGPGSTGMRNKKRYLGMSRFLVLNIKTTGLTLHSVQYDRGGGCYRSRDSSSYQC
jgi:hypothetical protein